MNLGSEPKPTVDKISELFEKFNKDWYNKLLETTNHFDPADKSDGVFYVTAVEKVGHTDYGSETLLFNFDTYCWSGLPDFSVDKYPRPDKQLLGVERFKEVVALMNKALEVYPLNEKADFIDETILDFENSIAAKLQDNEDLLFRQVLKQIRFQGVNAIRMAFIDYLNNRQQFDKDMMLQFNLSQDHLAFLLSVMIKGGFFGNQRKEVITFAKNYFKVVKSGKLNNDASDFVNLANFDAKISDFINGARFSAKARTTISEMFKKGGEAIDL